jgi:hypothetical protein
VVQPKSSDGKRRAFRIHAPAVLLKFVWSLAWSSGAVSWHMPGSMSRRGPSWAGNGAGTVNVHLMLQFSRKIVRTTRCFIFEGITPRADPNDLTGDGWCRTCMQQSIDRGMFHFWAKEVCMQTGSSMRPLVDG